LLFETFLAFNSTSSGPDISAATMVVHSAAALVPDSAKRFLASTSGEKELVWTTSENHVAFHDEDRLAPLAADNAARWFDQKL
jgi:hypothetical protein